MPIAISSIDYIETLIPSSVFVCKSNYLLLTATNDVMFMKGNLKDNCAINENMNCKT